MSIMEWFRKPEEEKSVREPSKIYRESPYYGGHNVTGVQPRVIEIPTEYSYGVDESSRDVHLKKTLDDSVYVTPKTSKRFSSEPAKAISRSQSFSGEPNSRVIRRSNNGILIPQNPITKMLFGSASEGHMTDDVNVADFILDGDAGPQEDLSFSHGKGSVQPKSSKALSRSQSFRGADPNSTMTRSSNATIIPDNPGKTRMLRRTNSSRWTGSPLDGSDTDHLQDLSYSATDASISNGVPKRNHDSRSASMPRSSFPLVDNPDVNTLGSAASFSKFLKHQTKVAYEEGRIPSSISNGGAHNSLPNQLEPDGHRNHSSWAPTFIPPGATETASDANIRMQSGRYSDGGNKSQRKYSGDISSGLSRGSANGIAYQQKHNGGLAKHSGHSDGCNSDRPYSHSMGLTRRDGDSYPDSSVTSSTPHLSHHSNHHTMSVPGVAAAYFNEGCLPSWAITASPGIAKINNFVQDCRSEVDAGSATRSTPHLSHHRNHHTMSVPGVAAAYFNEGCLPSWAMTASPKIAKINNFLQDCRSEVDAGCPGRWLTVVMGSETADLDSVVSAIAYAYYLYLTSKSEEYFYCPVINMRREEWRVHTDAVWLFECSGLDVKALLFVDEVTLSYYHRFGTLRLVLVDHSALAPHQENLQDAVIEIIDHHQRPEDLYEWVKKVEIEAVGSTCTIIAERFASKWPEELRGRSLSRLLLGAILCATVNLDENNGRSTTRDECMATLLLDGAGRYGLNGFFQLLKKKTTFDAPIFCAVRDLLRKDYQQWTLGPAKTDAHGVRGQFMAVGMSSIGFPLSVFINRDSGVIEGVTRFRMSMKLKLLMVVTGYYDSTNKYQKELLLASNDEELVRNLSNFFNERKPGLKLSPFHVSGLPAGMRGFIQGNANVSRKLIHSLIHEFSV